MAREEGVAPRCVGVPPPRGEERGVAAGHSLSGGVTNPRPPTPCCELGAGGGEALPPPACSRGGGAAATKALASSIDEAPADASLSDASGKSSARRLARSGAAYVLKAPTSARGDGL